VAAEADVSTAPALLPREGEKVSTKSTDEGVSFRMKSGAEDNLPDAPSSDRFAATFSPSRGRRAFTA